MPANHLELARRLVAESLTRLTGAWRVDGEVVRGPGHTSVVVAERHGSAPGHVDFGFLLDRRRPDLPVIWDCASGIGTTEEAALQRAVHTWTKGTAAVVLELLTGTGRLADRYRGDHPSGFAGWHVVHGPWLGWGTTPDGSRDLQQWALDRPLLPLLRAAIEPELVRGELNSLKLFFGSSPTGDTAEVRINGTERPGPSSALLEQDWPRPSGHAYMRAFCLLVHEDLDHLTTTGPFAPNALNLAESRLQRAARSGRKLLTHASRLLGSGPGDSET